MQPGLLGSLDSANRYAWTQEEGGRNDYISSYSFLPGMLGCQETIFGVFLGAFAKLRKATIIFDMSVCLSVRPHGTTLLLLEGFS
jgi:hypothetical protein